jgi:phage gpG-like protein
MRRAREIKDKRVRVGVLSDKGHDGEGSITLVELAAVHEFGTEDGAIPERSFLRSTFDQKREELVRTGEKLIGEVLDGKMEVDRALGLIGAQLASDVKTKITSSIPPPDKPATVARKGSSTTLIDTGRLRNSITWALDDKSEGE